MDPAKKKATQKMDLKDFYLIKKLGFPHIFNFLSY